MARRLLTLAAVALLPLALPGCVVVPAPGYIRPPMASAYVAPWPHAHGPHAHGPHGHGRRGHGWGWGRHDHWR